MRPADRYAGFLLDLDGVVYRGSEVLPGARDTIETLRGRGRRVLFLTNNSARGAAQVAERLTGMGIEAAPGDVLTSADATAERIAADAKRSGRPATAFVIGEDGLTGALEAAGITTADGDGPGYVVVGWDRGLDYEKLRRASILARSGATLVASNADATFPASGGELWPGAGSLLAAVETAAGRSADIVVGKPHRPMFDAALSRVGTGDVLVVGDRIETDVAGATSAGLDAALVLTGASAVSDLPDHDAQPRMVLPSLGSLLEDRPDATVRDARPDDEAAVAALLDAAALDRGDWDPHATVVAADGEVVGTSTAEVRGADAYLRSVAVREDGRGSLIGALLVSASLRRAAAAGAERAWLLTETAEGFFRRVGFEPVDDVPRWVAERSTECSDTAVRMTRAVRR